MYSSTSQNATTASPIVNPVNGSIVRTHPMYGHLYLFKNPNLLSVGMYVKLNASDPTKIEASSIFIEMLGRITQHLGSNMVEVKLLGSDVVLDDFVSKMWVLASSNPGTLKASTMFPIGAPTTATSTARTHPEYGQEYWFDNPDKLVTGDYVRLVSGSWSAVESVRKVIDILGYIRVIVGGSGGRVLVKLMGSDQVLDDFVQRKAAHLNKSASFTITTSGIVASAGGGGAGGGGSANTTLTQLNAGIVGVLNNDKTNDSKNELEDTLPDGWQNRTTFKTLQWCCTCPYCPERPAIKSLKVPTCYTCGDKMSPA